MATQSKPEPIGAQSFTPLLPGAVLFCRGLRLKNNGSTIVYVSVEPPCTALPRAELQLYASMQGQMASVGLSQALRGVAPLNSPVYDQFDNS